GDDGDHDQQFDECKGSPLHSCRRLLYRERYCEDCIAIVIPAAAERANAHPMEWHGRATPARFSD
ncbi:MAG TPA: hypothetical protein VM492_16000, partial [Sumerlaeia bacterium]|nr:hypothetical protein [Sumerlaeia bacterium]